MTAECACNCAMPSDSKSMKYCTTHPLQIFGHILCPMTMDWKIHLLQFPLSRNHTLCHFKYLNVSMRTMPKQRSSHAPIQSMEKLLGQAVETLMLQATASATFH
ncbi:uncharacterized protein LOC144425908 isoform X1 [Styela clava]